MVVLEPEVAGAFPDSASVNQALRGLAKARSARMARTRKQPR
jgi:hypothetical protein